MTGRARGVAATGVIIGVTMVLLGMEPRLVLVGLIVVAAAATIFLLLDLVEITAPVTWQDHRTRIEVTPAGDHRVRLLRVRMRQAPSTMSRVGGRATPDDDEPDGEIAASLVAIIDDHLRAELGIDRSTDPDAAAAVLDPELARFVADPGARRAMVGRRRLDATVSLVEDLVGPDQRTMS